MLVQFTYTKNVLRYKRMGKPLVNKKREILIVSGKPMTSDCEFLLQYSVSQWCICRLQVVLLPWWIKGACKYNDHTCDSIVWLCFELLQMFTTIQQLKMDLLGERHLKMEYKAQLPIRYRTLTTSEGTLNQPHFFSPLTFLSRTRGIFYAYSEHVIQFVWFQVDGQDIYSNPMIIPPIKVSELSAYIEKQKKEVDGFKREYQVWVLKFLPVQRKNYCGNVSAGIWFFSFTTFLCFVHHLCSALPVAKPRPQFPFQQLPTGDKAKWDVGNKVENRNKNRFVNIRACKQHVALFQFYDFSWVAQTLLEKCFPFSFADDHSRVVLEIQDGDVHSDYINADFITGYKDKEKAYVAAQGTHLPNMPIKSKKWTRRVHEDVSMLL